MKKHQNKQLRIIVICLAVACMLIAGAIHALRPKPAQNTGEGIPEYAGQAYVVLNDNQPGFTEKEITDKAYEFYSELDALNRCGYTMACIGTEFMPTEDRGNIGQVKPSGWQTVKYDSVDGKYLYNRCHLIGFQLTGENANERNLITGTRYLNIEGMLPFENMVADYIKETGNHVIYRVTPDFRGEELVARGVRMEAISVEDDGEGICFHIYAYNNQPGICIDYATGDSWEASELPPAATQLQEKAYIINTNAKKFHDADCGNGQQTKEENKEIYSGDRQKLIDAGYAPAGCCNP